MKESAFWIILDGFQTCLKIFYFQDDLKATLTAKNREAKQLSQLEKTRQRNPSDRHIIVSCISSGYKKYF